MDTVPNAQLRSLRQLLELGRLRGARRPAGAGGDYTGTVFSLAGLVLIGLALKLAADSLRVRATPAGRRASSDVIE